MKIAVITAWNDAYSEVAGITVPIMHLYCLRHGYEFLPYRGGFHLDLDRDKSLLSYGDRAKIRIYKDLYAHYDLIVWLDVDTVITNMDVQLEDILGERNFLWTYGPSGPLSGFTMARTTPEVLCALHAVYHRAAEDASPSAPGGRSDQDTMRFFMGMPPYDKVFGGDNCVSCKQAGHCFPFKLYGWEAFAYLGDWEPGDFLCTFPSLPLPQRIKMLEECRQAVYDA